MRLNKFIAHSGACSRRKADELILAGKVKVNGKIIKEMGIQINAASDTVSLNGSDIHTPKNFTYLMLHKPTGYTTTKSDPNTSAEETIYVLLPPQYHTLNPVGRLDKNSEGLLLLTDDGDFSYEMTHPKHDLSKTYEVRLKYPPKPIDIQRLQKGVNIIEETTKGRTVYRTEPCEITQGRDAKHFRVILREGRNRQIRKMFKKIGCPVVYLKRLSMGSYELGTLEKGKWMLTTDFRLKTIGTSEKYTDDCNFPPSATNDSDLLTVS